MAALLIREPANAFDENAIGVHVPALDGRIGYVPASEARWLAAVLDAGNNYLCEPLVAIKPGFEHYPGAYIRGRLAELGRSQAA